MKIIGSGRKVKTIRYKHKAMELSFQHFLGTRYMDEPAREDAVIEFCDIGEIGIMIGMLTEFAEGCKRELGSWKAKENEHDGE